MMGQQSRTEPLFYYFRLEEQIPTDHLLRMIDSHVDFTFVREQLKASYSPTGRPSIDPEVLLRLLLVGYLYGITSERRLIDEVRMHLAYRWFTRLGFEQEIPNHSTFSKNRHGRFRQSGVFRKDLEKASKALKRIRAARLTSAVSPISNRLMCLWAIRTTISYGSQFKHLPATCKRSFLGRAPCPRASTHLSGVH